MSKVKEFWEGYYGGGEIPWESHTPWSTPLLRKLLAEPSLAALPRASARVLVPGCGRGFEARLCADEGFADVTGADLLPAALQAARALDTTPAHKKIRYVEADMVAEGAADRLGTYDLVVERAMFCALPPKLWEAFLANTHALLKPGGLYAGLFFVLSPAELAAYTREGPPFPISEEELGQRLTPHFDPVMFQTAPVYLPGSPGQTPVGSVGIFRRR